MADKKISALASATTPLAGTEVLPIVQSGSTVKVSVGNLTAGRNVSVKQLSVTDFTAGSVVFAGAAGLYEQDNTNLFWDNSNNRLGIGTSTPVTSLNIYNGGSGVGNVVSATIANTDGSAGSQAIKIGSYQTGGTVLSGAQIRASYNYGGNAGTSISLDYCTVSGTITEGLRLDTSGNATFNTGNLVVGTAGKGIDFSANGGDVLKQYDEGTFTPTISSGATGITYAGQSGWYTRVGRVVTFGLNIVISAASAAAANFKVGGLPFTASAFGSGSFAYDNGTFINSSTTNMPMIFVTSGTTEISFFQGNGSQVQGTDINAIGSMNFYIVGTYIV